MCVGECIHIVAENAMGKGSYTHQVELVASTSSLVSGSIVGPSVCSSTVVGGGVGEIAISPCSMGGEVGGGVVTDGTKFSLV